MSRTPRCLLCIIPLVLCACSRGSLPPDGRFGQAEAGVSDLQVTQESGNGGDGPGRMDGPMDAAGDTGGGGDGPGSTDQGPPDQRLPDTLAPDTGPPLIDRCAHAKTLKLVNGKLTEQGDTSPMTNEFLQLKCGGAVALAGPQAYYKVSLAGGETYEVKVKPGTFDAYLYIFSPMAACKEQAMDKDCSSKGLTGDLSALAKKGSSQSVLFKAPGSGLYYIAVDSASKAQTGSFTLTVELSCARLDDACNTGINYLGQCMTQPKTGSCSDGNPCTTSDVCVTSGSKGICKGTPKTCPGDTCNSGKCTVSGSQAKCTKVYKAGSCSDAYGSCTSGDYCSNSGGVGVCKSGTWKQDSYEANNTCGGHAFNNFTESSSWHSRTASISPPGDYDWFKVYAEEANHFPCFPGTSQSYYFKVRLYVPSGRTFQVCLRKGSCTGSQYCSIGGGTREVSFKVNGVCALDDDTWAYWYIRATDSKTTCENYSFSYQYD